LVRAGTATIKYYLFRDPQHGRRHVLKMASGCVLILVGALYAGPPQIVRVSSISIGVLNLFLGPAELMSGDRVRLAGTLRVAAYLGFLAGMALIGILLAAASG
jgi:hypothetical protein